MNEGENSATPEFFSEAMAAHTPAPKPRNRRKMVIIGVIVAVLLVGLAVGLIILLSPKPEPPKKDARTLFNEFANYMLYGKEEDASDIIGKGELLKKYYYSDFKNQDKKAMLGKSKQAFREFRKAYEAQGVDEFIIKTFDTFEKEIDFAYYFEDFQYFNITKLIEYYAEDKNSIQKIIDEDYKDPGDSVLPETRAFVEEYRNAVVQSFGMVRELDRFGCIDKEAGKFNASCNSKSNPSYDSIQSVLEKCSEYESVMVKISSKHSKSIENIYSLVWLIKEYVYDNSGVLSHEE